MISEAAGDEEESAGGLQPALSSITEEKESHTSESGTFTESIPINEPSPVVPNLSSKDRQLTDNIVHIGHWLTETERDASLTVDLADLESIRNAIIHMQVFFRNQLEFTPKDVK